MGVLPLPLKLVCLAVQRTWEVTYNHGNKATNPSCGTYEPYELLSGLNIQVTRRKSKSLVGIGHSEESVSK